MIQERVEEVIMNIFYLKLQLLLVTQQDFGVFNVFIFQQNCCIAQDMASFLT